MASVLETLVVEYAPRGLLVDTNVLLLYLVGLFDRTFVERFKRTRARGYTADDFAIASNLMRCFRRVVTTPHILAEVSNLSFQMEEPRLIGYFRIVVRVLRGLHEQSVPKDLILDSPRLGLLPKIGFTDLSILEAAKRSKYLVLTDDRHVSIYVQFTP